MTQAPPSTARLAGTIMTAAGGACLAAAALGYAFVGAHIPPVMMYVNLGAAALDLGLGIGVMKRKRGAWAFAISVFAVLSLVNLLGLPHLTRAGTIGYVSITFAAIRVLVGALLISGSREFSSLSGGEAQK
jgi:hypothetical protein